LEIVDDSTILVDPSDVEQITDAMRLFLTQPALATALREKGLASAAQFSWERTARETIAVYERVLAGRGSGSKSQLPVVARQRPDH